MTALPKLSPLLAGLNPDFLQRVQDRRGMRALDRLVEDHLSQADKVRAKAEKDAQRLLDGARAEIALIHADLRCEAEALLAQLPAFDALEAVPARHERTVYRIVRRIADEHGLAMAAVTRPQRRNPKARAARIEAVQAVADQCPLLDDAAIGKLFNVCGREIARLRGLR